MQTDRSLISLADLVRRAQAIVDPHGEDDAVTEFVTRHEDADEPVRGQLDGLDERLLWGADEDPPIVMAQALVLYLAHRLDEVGDDPDELLRLAARAELDNPPPAPIGAWLEERGIALS
jgi:hypothetical protein